MNHELINELMAQLIEGQEKELQKQAAVICPHLTKDDLLQPNDFPALEQNPLFRYEEGALAGLKTAQAALNAFFAEMRKI